MLTSTKHKVWLKLLGINVVLQSTWLEIKVCTNLIFAMMMVLNERLAHFENDVNGKMYSITVRMLHFTAQRDAFRMNLLGTMNV